MTEILKQTMIEAEVDLLFERSDKIIHDLFQTVLDKVRLDYKLSQKENKYEYNDDNSGDEGSI